MNQADDPFKPMSYSNAIDVNNRISYREGMYNNSGYFEQFDNKYYNAIIEKNKKIKMKKDLKNEERVNQSKGMKGPTSGYFTCKAAKNPTLFESSLYNTATMPNADVKHMNHLQVKTEESA